MLFCVTLGGVGRCQCSSISSLASSYLQCLTEGGWMRRLHWFPLRFRCLCGLLPSGSVLVVSGGWSVFWGLTCCQMDDLSVTSQLPALNSQQSQYWYVRNLAPSDTEEFKDKQLRILPGMKQVCSHEGFMQEAVQVHHWKIYESICLETRWLNNSSVHWIFHFNFLV